jgi:hypothetical protein
MFEDFEGFTPYQQRTNQFVFSNGRLSSVVSDDEPEFAYWLDVIPCSVFGGDGANCLTNRATASDVRTFDLFPVGTTHWGADMEFVNSGNTIEIIVTGGSGTATFQGPTAEFYGFSDSLGLTSIAFHNLGTLGLVANYSFDNVTTASAVPIPAAVWLFGSALVGLGWMRRRKTV